MPTLQEDLLLLAARSGVTVSPTIAVVDQIPRVLGGSTLRNDPASRFLAGRTTLNDRLARLILPANSEWAEIWTNVWRDRTRRYRDAGVALAVGTDGSLPWLVHLELENLVAAGLSPIEALAVATSGSARALGIDSEVGTVQIGKLADLLLLDADPTSDIRNTRRIRAIIAQGRLVNRDGLLR